MPDDVPLKIAPSLKVRVCNIALALGPLVYSQHCPCKTARTKAIPAFFLPIKNDLDWLRWDAKPHQGCWLVTTNINTFFLRVSYMPFIFQSLMGEGSSENIYIYIYTKSHKCTCSHDVRSAICKCQGCCCGVGSPPRAMTRSKEETIVQLLVPKHFVSIIA